jgi:hypothetical protein
MAQVIFCSAVLGRPDTICNKSLGNVKRFLSERRIFRGARLFCHDIHHYLKLRSLLSARSISRLKIPAGHRACLINGAPAISNIALQTGAVAVLHQHPASIPAEILIDEILGSIVEGEVYIDLPAGAKAARPAFGAVVFHTRNNRKTCERAAKCSSGDLLGRVSLPKRMDCKIP